MMEGSNFIVFRLWGCFTGCNGPQELSSRERNTINILYPCCLEFLQGEEEARFIWELCVRVCACGEQELFLEKFVEDAFDRMQESHRNSITYSDLCKLLSYSSFILDYSFAISFLLLLLCLSHTETFCSQMHLLAIAYIACSAIRLGRGVCKPYWSFSDSLFKIKMFCPGCPASWCREWLDDVDMEIVQLD
jgi:hypothetical protein